MAPGAHTLHAQAISVQVRALAPVSESGAPSLPGVEVALGDAGSQEVGVVVAQGYAEDQLVDGRSDVRGEREGSDAHPGAGLKAAVDLARPEVVGVGVGHASSVPHCPACQVAIELRQHRDATAPGWSIRRGTLNFAIIIAERACSAYTPAGARSAGATAEVDDL